MPHTLNLTPKEQKMKLQPPKIKRILKKTFLFIFYVDRPYCSFKEGPYEPTRHFYT